MNKFILLIVVLGFSPSFAKNSKISDSDLEGRIIENTESAKTDCRLNDGGRAFCGEKGCVCYKGRSLERRIEMQNRQKKNRNESAFQGKSKRSKDSTIKDIDDPAKESYEK